MKLAPVFAALLFCSCSMLAPPVAAQGYDTGDGDYLQFKDTDFMPEAHSTKWVLEATGGILTGSYGNPFCYSGDPCHIEVDATASVNVDAEENTGVISVTFPVENYDLTNSSDPLFAPQGAYMGITGDLEIRYTAFADPTTDNSNKFMEGGVATNVFLHGTAAPVMPLSHAFFASWGPAELYLNGTKLFDGVNMFGHSMLTETLYNSDTRGVITDCDNPETWNAMMPPEDGEGCVEDPPTPSELHFNFRTFPGTGVTVHEDDEFMLTPIWLHLVFYDITDNSPSTTASPDFPTGLVVGIAAVVLVMAGFLAFVMYSRPAHEKHQEIKETPRNAEADKV